MDKNSRALIRKYTIKNAIEYGGKPNKGSVLGKVISKNPDLKKDMRALVLAIDEAAKGIASMSASELEAEYRKYSREIEAEREEKIELSAKHRMEIPGAEEGRFATRFPPEPGGYMHIGHAKAAFTEDALRNRYEGKLMLYFDDTNPDNSKQEFVDAFHEDLRWLGLKFDGEYYASDHIPMLYDYARIALAKGKAYVCTCDGDRVKELRMPGTDCEHKSQSVKRNSELWRMMLDGKFESGKAILRLNSDMRALNTTMRDPTLFRIKRATHYRQGDKYFVWPTYYFCTPIIDSLKGITDTLRGKEYEMTDELYYAVLDLLGLRKPRITSFARAEIANNITSKRKVRELIAEKKVQGWDDPRLVTIRGLRRRGVQPEAIRNFALRFGLGKAESVVNISMLLDENRKLIDPIAKRMSYVANPIPLTLSDFAKREIKIPIRSETGPTSRNVEVDGQVLIAGSDAESLVKGDVLNLKYLSTVRITKKLKKVIEAAPLEEKYERSIPWVPAQNPVECELVLLEDLLKGGEFNDKSLRTEKGLIEPFALGLKKGDIVYLERVGFAIVDDREKMRLILTSG